MVDDSGVLFTQRTQEISELEFGIILVSESK